MNKEDFIEKWSQLAMMTVEDAITYYEFVPCDTSRSGWRVLPKS